MAVRASFGVAQACSMGSLYWSEGHLPSSLAAILVATEPFWVALMAHRFVTGERLGLRSVAALGVRLSGRAHEMRRALAFVLAASPIETARVLLASELGPLAARVGLGLVDHMVASYILLEPHPAPTHAGRSPHPGCAVVDSPSS